MPLPIGFLELDSLNFEKSLGPFSDLQKVPRDQWPVFLAFRIWWHADNRKPTDAALAKGYPAAELYGGPVPLKWALINLPPLVRSWVASWPMKEPGGHWIAHLARTAFLVPREVLRYSPVPFGWHWSYEPAKPPQYIIEGNRLAPLFRNTTTGKLEGPPPAGPGRITVAGEGLPDWLDPPVVTWLTEEQVYQSALQDEQVRDLLGASWGPGGWRWWYVLNTKWGGPVGSKSSPYTVMGPRWLSRAGAAEWLMQVSRTNRPSGGFSFYSDLYGWNGKKWVGAYDRSIWPEP